MRSQKQKGIDLGLSRALPEVEAGNLVLDAILLEPRILRTHEKGAVRCLIGSPGTKVGIGAGGNGQTGTEEVG